MLLLILILKSTHCQDNPLGAGLVFIEADCSTKVRDCVSPPCRFFCPKECNNISENQKFNKSSEVCREARHLLSDKLALDVQITNNSVSLVQSVHSMSLSRRYYQPYCPGELQVADAASICIVTCAAPDYECPTRYKQRCACPSNKPILKDAMQGTCVRTIRDCPPFNTYILPRGGLQKFSFTKQPMDMVRNRGEAVRMECAVSGNTNYRYFWYKADTLVAGSHSIMRSSDDYLQETGKSYLYISGVQPSDSGFYHCIVRTGDSVGESDSRYSLVSRSGYLRVEYYNKPKTPKEETEPSQDSAIYVILPCNLPDSVPRVDAVWYKNGTLVSDERKFIVPEDTDKASRGSLYILMVTKADEGLYVCKCSYKSQLPDIVSKVTLKVSGHIGQPKSKPQIVVKVPGRARVGEDAVFYCAGIGSPVPTVEWSYEDKTRIQVSDTIKLEDFKRRLVLSNVQPDQKRPFDCTVSTGNPGTERTTLLYLSIQPSSYEINFVRSPQSHTILPNRYTPFSLHCVIQIDPIVDSPLMYWIKDSAVLDMSRPTRIRTITKETILNGTAVRNSTLIFDTPNESDKGVYQCIVENKKQMRQATAYVDVEKPSVYDIYYQQQYHVNTTKVTVSEASDFCRNIWHPAGNLVTILNKNESETVFRLMVENGITQAWIGLTSENPTYKPGNWIWTTSHATSQDFSYWYAGSPDNALGNETYAIADITKAGHWLDVQNEARYPFVCSRYTATCPSVAEFFNNSARPVVNVEEADATYRVGATVTVTCDDDANGQITQQVTCSPSGDFVPGTLACPVKSSVSRSSVPCFTAAVILLLFWFR